jgi:hypothetical protein
MLTHFFDLQKVLPRRIQQKYFQMIKSKLLDRDKVLSSRAKGTTSSNRTTKSFFKFTYKKYRFYFGIYTPCNHSYDPCLPALNNIWSFDTLQSEELTVSEVHQLFKRCKECSVPSPFVMSQDRRACVMHQKYFFSRIDNTNVDLNQEKPSKVTESERCFQKWHNKSITSVKSHRLGISYKSHINANGRRHIKFTPSGYIYQKY